MDILVYLFKNRICKSFNINPFKNAESDKTSVDNTHTQGACGGESIDSLTVRVPHSPTINAEYVSVSQVLSLFLVLLNKWLSSDYQ